MWDHFLERGRLWWCTVPERFFVLLTRPTRTRYGPQLTKRKKKEECGPVVWGAGIWSRQVLLRCVLGSWILKARIHLYRAPGAFWWLLFRFPGTPGHPVCVPESVLCVGLIAYLGPRTRALTCGFCHPTSAPGGTSSSDPQAWSTGQRGAPARLHRGATGSSSALRGYCQL